MKYLILVVNSILKLAIVCVGVLFAVNLFFGGLLFTPDVLDRVSVHMIGDGSKLFPGLIPVFYLLTLLVLTILSLNITLRLAMKADIAKKINSGVAGEIKKAYKAGRATGKPEGGKK